MSHNDDHPFPGAPKAQYYKGFRPKDLGTPGGFPQRNTHYRIYRGNVCHIVKNIPLNCFKCGGVMRKKRYSWMPARKKHGEFTRRKTEQPVKVWNETSSMWVLQHINCTSKTQFDAENDYSTDGELSHESTGSSTQAMSHNPAEDSGECGEKCSSGASGSGGLQAGSSNDGGNPAPSNVALVRNGLSYKNPADPGWQR